MKPWIMGAAFAAGVLCGCMTAGPPAPASTDSAPPSGATSAGPAERDASDLLGTPLLIDRTDLRLGTTVQFRRLPTPGELHDTAEMPGLAHVVLSLSSWPQSDAPIEVLNQLPEGADLIVLLAGYPPTRAAAEIWRYVGIPLRMIVVVQGPPPTRAMVDDLNAMPQLERVIAQMDQPLRSGFERLQRPLSFRVLAN